MGYIRELGVKKTEAVDIISEVSLAAQEANQRAPTKPQISPGKIIFQYLFL